MSYKKVLLGLSLAVVITAAAVTANVGFAQAEDPTFQVSTLYALDVGRGRWLDGR
jgi:hypothetical protein